MLQGASYKRHVKKVVQTWNSVFLYLPTCMANEELKDLYPKRLQIGYQVKYRGPYADIRSVTGRYRQLRGALSAT